MKEKRREAEELMSHIHLHEELREKVRKHKRYQWEINRGFQLDSFLRDLPRHLKRDIMRHLCLDLLKRVSDNLFPTQKFTLLILTVVWNS